MSSSWIVDYIIKQEQHGWRMHKTKHVFVVSTTRRAFMLKASTTGVVGGAPPQAPAEIWHAGGSTSCALTLKGPRKIQVEVTAAGASGVAGAVRALFVAVFDGPTSAASCIAALLSIGATLASTSLTSSSLSGSQLDTQELPSLRTPQLLAIASQPAAPRSAPASVAVSTGPAQAQAAVVSSALTRPVAAAVYAVAPIPHASAPLPATSAAPPPSTLLRESEPAAETVLPSSSAGEAEAASTSKQDGVGEAGVVSTPSQSLLASRALQCSERSLAEESSAATANQAPAPPAQVLLRQAAAALDARFPERLPHLQFQSFCGPVLETSAPVSGALVAPASAHATSGPPAPASPAAAPASPAAPALALRMAPAAGADEELARFVRGMEAAAALGLDPLGSLNALRTKAGTSENIASSGAGAGGDGSLAVLLETLLGHTDEVAGLVWRLTAACGRTLAPGKQPCQKAIASNVSRDAPTASKLPSLFSAPRRSLRRAQPTHVEPGATAPAAAAATAPAASGDEEAAATARDDTQDVILPTIHRQRRTAFCTAMAVSASLTRAGAVAALPVTGGKRSGFSGRSNAHSLKPPANRRFKKGGSASSPTSFAATADSVAPLAASALTDEPMTRAAVT